MRTSQKPPPATNGPRVPFEFRHGRMVSPTSAMYRRVVSLASAMHGLMVSPTSAMHGRIVSLTSAMLCLATARTDGFSRQCYQHIATLRISARSLSGPSITSLSISRHHELTYNLGIQLLHCGKPQAAFDCLLEVIQFYHINPRLWLRLAECCIQVHREVIRSFL